MKKNIFIMKKKIVSANRFWATAQLYCEFVLQALQLYCKREGWKKKFIVKKKNLYCNTLVCIAKKKAENSIAIGYCIATWAVGLLGNCIAIHTVYCDQSG